MFQDSKPILGVKRKARPTTLDEDSINPKEVVLDEDSQELTLGVKGVYKERRTLGAGSFVKVSLYEHPRTQNQIAVNNKLNSAH